MISELLLVLAGQPSSFLIPTPSPPEEATTLATSQSLSEYLHPGELSSINTLGQLAFRYRKVRAWALDVQLQSRKGILKNASISSGSRKGKQREVQGAVDEGDIFPDVYLSTLAAGILDVLQEYEILVVTTETKVLSLNPGYVQDENTGYVPLSTLIATFDSWQAPLASLFTLIDTLSDNQRWTPAMVMEEVYSRTQTGHPKLQAIYETLLSRLHQQFLLHLTTFMLHGLAQAEADKSGLALGLDIGADELSPSHRVYKLNEDLLPDSVGRGTRESILYVGRVAATLKREGKGLPEEILSGIREGIGEIKGLQEGEGLSEVIQRARAEVGEWLWKNVLTGPQIIEAIETFGNYFLTRNASLTNAFINQVHTLLITKLLNSNPKSSSSVIREQDLHLALLRSSVSTSAENDKSLDTMRFKLPSGPLRPLQPSARRTTNTAKDNGVGNLFSSFVLGAPMIMTTRTTWPLDLFITPSTLSAYSEINSYLTALRDTHLRVSATWTSLSAAQRNRRKWTGNTEGGTAEEMQQRRDLGRRAWGIIRMMLFWLDEVIGHFMVDIIDVQHRRLLEQLEGVSVERSTTINSAANSLRGSVRPTSPATQFHASRSQFGEKTASPGQSVYDGIAETGTIRSRAPPTPSKQAQKRYLDFLTLRTIHTRHLSFLREGLLIADREMAIMIRDILETCRRFTGMVERWGGDVLPGLLDDDGEGDLGSLMKQRSAAVEEIMTSLQDQLSDFFRALVETQNPTPVNVDASTATAVPGATSFSRTARTMQMMRSGMMSRQISFAGKAAGNAKDKERDEKALEAEALMGKHIEQLLLRLDFNGVFTSWLDDEAEGVASKHILAEGGL